MAESCEPLVIDPDGLRKRPDKRKITNMLGVLLKTYWESGGDYKEEQMQVMDGLIHACPALAPEKDALIEQTLYTATHWNK